MKKKDIIQLVKNVVKENTFYGNREQPSTLGSTTAVVPTDEYPFSKRPKRTGTGMMDEEGESWGLEPRQLADSFTFEELEQLYNDNKISKEDLNGAKSYLQAWIDMHPTYLPQRDLTEPKRQKIRDKYLSENTAPKEMAGRIKSVFDKVNGAQHPVQTPEWHKNRFKNKYGISFPEDIKNINKEQALAMNKYANDMKIKESTYAGKTAIDDITKDPAFSALSSDAKDQVKKDLSKGGTTTLEQDDSVGGPGATIPGIDEFIKVSQVWANNGKHLKAHGESEKLSFEELLNHIESQIQQFRKPTNEIGEPGPLAGYMKERGDSNLNEHMDKHRKRSMLMEGAMKKFFEAFDMGKTDEEIIQDYAQRGTQVPEAFVSKARKQYEGLKKMKLELEMSEKEYKNSATQIVNNPATGEMDGSTTMETKQLSSDLFNEELENKKAINKNKTK